LIGRIKHAGSANGDRNPCEPASPAPASIRADPAGGGIRQFIQIGYFSSFPFAIDH
jgi:hypothetical protein